jgi:hypothetical protein
LPGQLKVENDTISSWQIVNTLFEFLERIDWNLCTVRQSAFQYLRGYEDFEVLKDDPNMIVRAGGAAAYAAYLDKFRDRHNTKLMGHWHPYNDINPDQPQASTLFLAGNQGGRGSDVDGFDPAARTQREDGYNSETGLSGGGMGGLSRYVAVAPRDVSINVRNLDFGL